MKKYYNLVVSVLDENGNRVNSEDVTGSSDKKEIHKRVIEVLDLVGLKNKVRQFPDQLSGGELQRVAIILCLGKPANIYLIDEPSAYLDSEQRIICARVR